MKQSRMRAAAASVVLLLFASSCAKTGATGQAQQPPHPSRDPSSNQGSEVNTATLIVSAREAVDVYELLARARASLLNGDHKSAARDFQIVAEQAHEAEVRSLALRGWGTVLDLEGQPQKSLELYRRAFDVSSNAEAKVELQVRMLRLLSYLERYREAGEIASKLDVSGRSPLQQIAVHAGRALFALSESRLAEAERSVGDGRAIIFEHSLDTVRVPPLDVASLYFAQGEIYRLRALEIRFEPLPEEFLEHLEARCQLILDSQGAYSEAMRSEDAHWSSMSGVRVGQLYQDLHRELMAIPIPKSATTEEKRLLFEGALRLRYSVLLRKSLSMMKATVALLERNQQDSPWRERARLALSDIEAAQKREEELIDALPYSRERLKAALRALEAKSKNQSGS